MARWVCYLFAMATAVGAAGLARAAESPVERGAYLAQIMDCTGCHTPGALRGEPDMDRFLAGADIGFELPDLGIFYAPNLTPDPETGLGGWSADEIVQAIIRGERPDGRELVPIMPWPSYGGLSEADAKALAAYLLSLAPIVSQVPGPLAPGADSPLPYFRLKVPK
ncbi:MAG: c-type cytochrome [Rhodospirillaceae bacterium]|jgi:mono/diheme cytochrome c family protein|nr:c-type cytochrome [Rhodospirillaceae bacterium]MBT6116566.1 c-type cytochrome [Rhodospirillaceae bacterium]